MIPSILSRVSRRSITPVLQETLCEYVILTAGKYFIINLILISWPNQTIRVTRYYRGYLMAYYISLYNESTTPIAITEFTEILYNVNEVYRKPIGYLYRPNIVVRDKE